MYLNGYIRVDENHNGYKWGNIVLQYNTVQFWFYILGTELGEDIIINWWNFA